MQLKIIGQSDIGKLRTNNEDSFYIDEVENIMILSDGMGGQDSGEIASAIVVKILPSQIGAGKSAGRFHSVETAVDYLVQALGILSETIYEKGIEFAQSRGMGATVVAGVLLKESLIIAHLGDSRAYLLREGVFERLTVDHNMAELLLQNKMITQKAYENHPGRHMLRKFVGMRDCPDADVGVLDLMKGDRILFCSDGLSGQVNDQTIGQLLLDQQDPTRACQQLIDLANGAGGDDNVTIIIADVPTEEDEKKIHKKVRVRKEVRKIQRLIAGSSKYEDPYSTI